MDFHRSDSRRFYLILVILLGLNLWQAYKMGLCHDEAYYWVFSRFLDWGYFDHPPMVAAGIAAGYWLIPNELGVRLLFVIMQVVAIACMWKLTNRRDASLFWILILSFPLLQVGGILALPDMPLFFFATLFLVAVKRYIVKDDWVSIAAMSVCASLMLYSKYHGVLVILLTMIAAPALLRRKTFWIIVVSTVVLLLPHILWQVDHDLVSVRFQLSREPDWFRPGLILEYVIGQIGSAGILSGIILLYLVIFRARSKEAFERVLRLNCVGLLAFFLIMSLKGKVEANWTLVAYSPLAILGHKFLQQQRRLRKWVMWLALIPIVGSFAVKAIFVFPPEESTLLRRAYEFSDWRQITGEVEDFAEGLPIAAGTYPHAASLSFYSGQPVPALNIRSRENQFSLLRLEEGLGESQVCFVSNFPIPDATMMSLRQGDRIYLLKGLTVAEIESRFR